LSAQVDLTGHLSNPCPARLRLLDSLLPRIGDGCTGTAQTWPRQKQVRLSPEQQAALVARYEAGAFNKKLARIYGIHVETVRATIWRFA